MANNLNSIEIQGLVWKPDKDLKPVLSDIDGILRSGDFYAILGPNGAGKSSLVRQLLKLAKRSTGEIDFEINNSQTGIDDIDRAQMAGLVSFLPQSFGADVDFSVYDIVAMGREPHRKSFAGLNDNDRKIIDEAMEYTNCAHLKDRSIQLLSGGEKQRVMIARTIAQDTPWIILDEPVSSLDIKHQYALMKLLQRLRKEKNKTIVAILHDLNLAYSFCNKIILMKESGIYAQGDTRDIMTVQNLKNVYEMDFEFVTVNGSSGKCIAVKY